MCVYIYIHIIEYSSVIKKMKWNSAICSKMDGLRGCYAKWSKAFKDILCDITYMLNLRNRSSEHNKKETDLQIEQTSS